MHILPHTHTGVPYVYGAPYTYRRPIHTSAQKFFNTAGELGRAHAATREKGWPLLHQIYYRMILGSTNTTILKSFYYMNILLCIITCKVFKY